MTEKKYPVAVEVNGRKHTGEVPARLTLVDWLRDELHLTGTHIGCEHGICGACTIMMDGRAVRSCLMFAVQADGHRFTTVEGLKQPDGKLSPLQDAFCEEHGLQCGYCTPGMLMTAHALLQNEPNPSREAIREAISGNICRCTGYQQIVDAVARAAERMNEGDRS